ncbi:MAG: hypothetical protein OCD01_17800 [Fibrobacterales bacterium]
MKETQTTQTIASDFKLYYDAECPVCASFVGLLRKKVPEMTIEYIALPDDSESDDFTFIAFDNSFYGKEAIDEMSRHFPQILDYFWMLPPTYRHEAVKKVYGVAGYIRSFYRTLMGKKCRSCNKKKSKLSH